MDAVPLAGGGWLRLALFSHAALIMGLHGVFALPTKAASFAVFLVGVAATIGFWMFALHVWRKTAAMSDGADRAVVADVGQDSPDSSDGTR